jgi:hypothetical protein
VKKSLIIVVAIAALVVAAAFYLWAPGSVPRAQKPLVQLRGPDVVQFESVFDAAHNMPRVVLLLSPT